MGLQLSSHRSLLVPFVVVSWTSLLAACGPSGVVDPYPVNPDPDRSPTSGTGGSGAGGGGTSLPGGQGGAGGTAASPTAGSGGSPAGSRRFIGGAEHPRNRRQRRQRWNARQLHPGRRRRCTDHRCPARHHVGGPARHAAARHARPHQHHAGAFTGRLGAAPRHDARGSPGHGPQRHAAASAAAGGGRRRAGRAAHPVQRRLSWPARRVLRQRRLHRVEVRPPGCAHRLRLGGHAARSLDGDATRSRFAGSGRFAPASARTTPSRSRPTTTSACGSPAASC